MPLNRSCSLEALRDNIAAEIEAGSPRDRAVAVAHATLREACGQLNLPVPDTKGVAREFKRKRGERSHDYLEEALSEARKKLPHRDFAVIHQAARSRAGGRASARTRMSSVEKSLLLGPHCLTSLELGDALARAEEIEGADMRRGLDLGGAALANSLRIEKSRREYVAKSDPGSGDVHVPTPLGERRKKQKARRPDLYEAQKADRTNDPGIMIALRLPPKTAEAIALDTNISEPANRLHVTLAYLGRMSVVGVDGLAMAYSAAASAAYDYGVLKGSIAGIGRFAATPSSDGKDVIIALVDVPGLGDFRRRVCAELSCRGLSYSEEHEYMPHITLAYVERGAPTPKIWDDLRQRDVFFDKVVVAVNDADTAYELGREQLLADTRAEMAAMAAQAREAGQAAIASATVEVIESDDQCVVLQSADGHTLSASTKADSDYEPGDLVEVSCDINGTHVVEGASASVLAAEYESVEKSLSAAYDSRLHNTPVPFMGPAEARVVFVAGAPSKVELARMEPLVGADGVSFAERYLAPLGVSKSDVAVGFACPVHPRVPIDQLSTEQTGPWRENLEKELARYPGATIVALGKAAHEALGERALLWLPHPSAARLNEARYEEQVARKVRRVRKALDDGFVFAQDDQHQGARSDDTAPEILAGRIGESLAAGPNLTLVKIAKAADELKIVCGVVLDPYEVDTQGEWVPPAIVQATAIDFVKKSRVIGREHNKPASAAMVESWIVPYPTQKDRDAAMAGLPHSVYVMPYGEDKVHSGAWIMGVQLGDAEWAARGRGEITGFSIGGFSYKTRVGKDAMPKVTFVPLVPAQ